MEIWVRNKFTPHFSRKGMKGFFIKSRLNSPPLLAGMNGQDEDFLRA
jgi:hypothetical protein